MPHEILKHTADLRIKVTGTDLEELFRDAFLAMSQIMTPQTSTATTQHKLELTANDPTELLINFLNEVLSLSHIHKEHYSQVTFANLTNTKLTAEIHGAHIQQFTEDIKAVTFHEAEIQKNAENQLQTNIIFDI